jgi:hypothetical protein
MMRHGKIKESARKIRLQELRNKKLLNLVGVLAAMEGINEGEVTGAIGVVNESAMDGLPNVRRGPRQEKTFSS